ncbi:MAG: sulfotransferase domain-containing protein [Pirellulales bacterium]
MRLWRRRTAANEARYLAGELPPASDRPSTLHFTLHKCASVYLRARLHKLARWTGLAPLDMDGYFFDSARPQPFEVRPRGYFYGPFRSLDDAFDVPREWPDFSEHKLVVVVRDPRDVLTSLYYSTAFSHRTPRGDGRSKFLSLRDEARHVDINEYVRREADTFLPRYRAYFRLAGRYEAHLTTYERLVTSPRAWLDELLGYLDVRLSRWRRRRLISPSDFAVKAENPAAHVRQVQPGDHARKLKADTIAWLDVKFAEVLDWYDRRRHRAA